MAPRTFWTVLVKLLGVYTILQSLTGIPAFLVNIVFFTNGSSDTVNRLYAIEAVYYVMVGVVYLTVFWICIFKTDWLIDKLRLDEGYADSRFEFTVHRSTLIKIVVMLIGGFLIVDSFPMFCQQLLSYYRQEASFHYDKFNQNPSAKYMTVYAIKIIIGYCMLTCSRMIVNFIEHKRKYPVQATEE